MATDMNRRKFSKDTAATGHSRPGASVREAIGLYTTASLGAEIPLSTPNAAPEGFLNFGGPEIVCRADEDGGYVVTDIDGAEEHFRDQSDATRHKRECLASAVELGVESFAAAYGKDVSVLKFAIKDAAEGDFDRLKEWGIHAVEFIRSAKTGKDVAVVLNKGGRTARVDLDFKCLHDHVGLLGLQNYWGGS